LLISPAGVLLVPPLGMAEDLASASGGDPYGSFAAEQDSSEAFPSWNSLAGAPPWPGGQAAWPPWQAGMRGESDGSGGQQEPWMGGPAHWAATMGGKGPGAGGLQNTDRAAAAWLWQQHVAAMSGMLPPGGMPYPYSGAGHGPAWGDAAGQPPWGAWEDSSWQWAGQPFNSPYGRGGHPRGEDAHPAAPAQPTDVAAWDGQTTLTAGSWSQPGAFPRLREQAEVVDQKALDLLQQMRKERAAPKAAGGGSAAGGPADGTPGNLSDASQEGDTIAQDIQSAVQLFLAGADDGGFESGSEEGSDDGSLAPQPSEAPPPSAAAEVPAARKEGPPKSVSRLAGFPSPENVKDFLQVLQRRALPPDVEDKIPLVELVIFQCINSLYIDRIKPVLNAVQRRLHERSKEQMGVDIDGVVTALLPICARHPERYWILPPMHGDQPVILLHEEPEAFQGWVDVEAPDGSYSAEVWEALATLLQVGETLPSPPYQAALEIRQRNPPHLAKLSLGELEHIVRLSLGARGILCQRGPYYHRVRGPHEDKAMQPKPVGEVRPQVQDDPGSVDANESHPESPTDIVDKEDLTVVLLDLMQQYPDGIRLSMMKHHVQMHCKRNLNEGNFNCTKLQEVFKLRPLSQIFPLEHRPHRNEIIVKPPVCSDNIPAHIWHRWYSAQVGAAAADLA